MMKFLTYTANDEVLVVMPGDQNYNEQTMVRAMFKGPHEDTPISPAFDPAEGFVGDRDPAEYERQIVETGFDPFLIVSLRTSFTFS